MGDCKPGFFYLLFFSLIQLSTFAQTTLYQSPSRAPSNSKDGRVESPFKPTIAIIVAILTILFSVTFLLLLYNKHCTRRTGHVNGQGGGGAGNGGGGGDGGINGDGRKNSGIDRAIIDSLPVFRFGSLRGGKNGLECAVCLARFDPNEVLRLLPKCKHAFHVECVDTWLDAHSTCPLCRYRVEPEDIVLIGDGGSLRENNIPEDPPARENRRVSGRHSWAGDGILRMFKNRPGEPDPRPSSSAHEPTTTHRRSLDASLRNNNELSSVTVGCFDRRKDGLLLSADDKSTAEDKKRRFDHKIIISSFESTSEQKRWSDLHPSDLMLLRSEMIINDNRRFSADPAVINQVEGKGRMVNSDRTVSDLTSVRTEISNNRSRQRQRSDGVLSRWLGWVSSQSRVSVRSHGDRTTNTTAINDNDVGSLV